MKGIWSVINVLQQFSKVMLAELFHAVFRKGKGPWYLLFRCAILQSQKWQLIGMC